MQLFQRRIAFCSIGVLTFAGIFAQSQRIHISDQVNLGAAKTGSQGPKKALIISKSLFGPQQALKIKFKPRAFTDNGLPSGRRLKGERISGVGRKSYTEEEMIGGVNQIESELNDVGATLYDRAESETVPVLKMRTNFTRSLSDQASSLQNRGLMNGYRNAMSVLEARSAIQTQIKLPKIDLSKQKLKNNLASLVSQADALIKAGKALEAQRKYEEAMEVYETNRYKGPDAFSRTVTLVDEELGDPAWFSISIKSGLSQYGDKTKRSVTANADVFATMLGQQVTLVHVLAEAGGTETIGRPGIRIPGSKETKAIARLEANILGDDLIPPVSTNDGVPIQRTGLVKEVGWEYGINIPIIPAISAVGTVGAKGSVSVTLTLNSSRYGGSINLTPAVNSSIYAMAGVSIGIPLVNVEGGVGAEMTLLNYNLNISAGADTDLAVYNGIRHHAILAPISVAHSFDALSGRLFGYAKISYWLPFKTRHKMLWQGDIFKWAGFTANKTIINLGAEPQLLPIPYVLDIPTPPKK